MKFKHKFSKFDEAIITLTEKIVSNAVFQQQYSMYLNFLQKFQKSHRFLNVQSRV